MIEETNKYLTPPKKVEEHRVCDQSMGKLVKLRTQIDNPPSSRTSKINLTHRKFEYDFSETGRIIDTESIVAALFRKKKSLILKEEYHLKSESSKNLDYIRKRLLEMEYVTGQTFTDFLVTVVESLVNFNNVFLLKNRNEFSSSGSYVDDKPPIASLHVLSPTRLSPITNEVGDVLGYRYKDKRGLKYFDFPKESIYHLFTDKRIDMTVGTPPLEAVKDDILGLRQAEESIERLIYTHASPFIHVKVGTDQLPAQMMETGELEIDYYARQVEMMEQNGGMTTSHRVNISQLGAESQALRAAEYLQYFKSRVLSGLKASPLDIGEANSISTAGADYVSQVLKEDVIAYQKVLERFFSNVFFNDLLLESPRYGNNNRIPHNEEVKLKLLESDVNTMIRVESHLANLVRYGLLDPEEFSRETGRTLPPQTLLPNQIAANISTSSTGAFSANSTPQNQKTDHLDVEYQVLDEIVSSDDSKLFTKIYFHLLENFSDILQDKDIEYISSSLAESVTKFKSKGITVRQISKIINSTLEKAIIAKIGENSEQ